jgi:hypothetical protein
MKKFRINIKLVTVFVFIVLLTSCRDLFDNDELSKNPNDPTEDQITIAPLTKGTLVGLGTLHEDTDTRIAFMWGGQLAGQSRQHAGFQNYTVAASTFSWANYYNVLKNVKLINAKAASINNKQTVGMAQVLEAMVMLKLTSLWGDVPYSEALDETAHPTPKYDSQLSIYNALVALLNSAYANLNSDVGSISGDFIYGGSSTKWAEAAKTLQARIYLHLKNYPNAISAAKLGISSTDNDMLMIHGTALQVDVNLNFDFFDNSRPGDTSFDPPAYLPVFMCNNISTKTKRIDKAKRNAKTDETGIYFHFFQYAAESSNGLDPNTIDGMFVNNAPHPLLTYYENQLILAEAIARSSPSLDDAILSLNNVRSVLATGYINGLTSSYPTLGMNGKIKCSTASPTVTGTKTKFKTDFQVDDQLLDSLGTYIGSVASVIDDTNMTLKANAQVDVANSKGFPVKFQRNALIYEDYELEDFTPGGVLNPESKYPNAQTALLAEIASEKFVVLLAQYEVFNELRRLQVASPVISLGIPISIGSRYPARFIYPQNEINTNPNTPNPAPDQFTKLPIFQ